MEMKDNGNVAGAYRDWITAVEQMRKTESELLDVLARRKTLVPVDQVKELFLRMIETTKGLLLVMPAKLSGELEGMEWQDIQKRLDGEIRDILTNLTTSTAF
jgi:DNA-binding cell septation regulator SpoVG